MLTKKVNQWQTGLWVFCELVSLAAVEISLELFLLVFGIVLRRLLLIFVLAMEEQSPTPDRLDMPSGATSNFNDRRDPI